MNVVDSSGWLEYIANAPNAPFCKTCTTWRKIMISKKTLKISVDKFMGSSLLRVYLLVIILLALGIALGLYLSSPIFFHIAEFYAQGLISSREIWQMLIWLYVIYGLALYIFNSLSKQTVITNHNYFLAQMIFIGMLGAPPGLLLVLMLVSGE